MSSKKCRSQLKSANCFWKLEILFRIGREKRILSRSLRRSEQVFELGSLTANEKLKELMKVKTKLSQHVLPMQAPPIPLHPFLIIFLPVFYAYVNQKREVTFKEIMMNNHQILVSRIFEYRAKKMLLEKTMLE